MMLLKGVDVGYPGENAWNGPVIGIGGRLRTEAVLPPATALVNTASPAGHFK